MKLAILNIKTSTILSKVYQNIQWWSFKERCTVAIDPTGYPEAPVRVYPTPGWSMYDGLDNEVLTPPETLPSSREDTVKHSKFNRIKRR